MYQMNQHSRETDKRSYADKYRSAMEVERRRQEVDHLIEQMAIDCAYAAKQLSRQPQTTDSVQRAFDALDRVNEVRELFEPRRE